MYSEWIGAGKPHGGVAKIRSLLKCSTAQIHRWYAAFSDGKLGMSRKGIGGRPTVMTPEKIAEIEEVLLENDYEMTFRELGEAVDLVPTSINRFWAKNKGVGYRQVGKKMIPMLTGLRAKSFLGGTSPTASAGGWIWTRSGSRPIGGRNSRLRPAPRASCR
jgi:hypothetical protein